MATVTYKDGKAYTKETTKSGGTIYRRIYSHDVPAATTSIRRRKDGEYLERQSPEGKTIYSPVVQKQDPETKEYKYYREYTTPKGFRDYREMPTYTPKTPTQQAERPLLSSPYTSTGKPPAWAIASPSQDQILAQPSKWGYDVTKSDTGIEGKTRITYTPRREITDVSYKKSADVYLTEQALLSENTDLIGKPVKVDYGEAGTKVLIVQKGKPENIAATKLDYEIGHKTSGFDMILTDPYKYELGQRKLQVENIYKSGNVLEQAAFTVSTGLFSMTDPFGLYSLGDVGAGLLGDTKARDRIIERKATAIIGDVKNEKGKVVAAGLESVRGDPLRTAGLLAGSPAGMMLGYKPLAFATKGLGAAMTSTTWGSKYLPTAAKLFNIGVKGVVAYDVGSELAAGRYSEAFGKSVFYGASFKVAAKEFGYYWGGAAKAAAAKTPESRLLLTETTPIKTTSLKGGIKETGTYKGIYEQTKTLKTFWGKDKIVTTQTAISGRYNSLMPSRDITTTLRTGGSTIKIGIPKENAVSVFTGKIPTKTFFGRPSTKDLTALTFSTELKAGTYASIGFSQTGKAAPIVSMSLTKISGKPLAFDTQPAYKPIKITKLYDVGAGSPSQAKAMTYLKNNEIAISSKLFARQGTYARPSTKGIFETRLKHELIHAYSPDLPEAEVMRLTGVKNPIIDAKVAAYFKTGATPKLQTGIKEQSLYGKAAYHISGGKGTLELGGIRQTDKIVETIRTGSLAFGGQGSTAVTTLQKTTLGTQGLGMAVSKAISGSTSQIVTPRLVMSIPSTSGKSQVISLQIPRQLRVTDTKVGSLRITDTLQGTKQPNILKPRELLIYDTKTKYGNLGGTIGLQVTDEATDTIAGVMLLRLTSQATRLQDITPAVTMPTITPAMIIMPPITGGFAAGGLGGGGYSLGGLPKLTGSKGKARKQLIPSLPNVLKFTASNPLTQPKKIKATRGKWAKAEAGLFLDVPLEASDLKKIGKGLSLGTGKGLKLGKGGGLSLKGMKLNFKGGLKI